MGRVRQLGFANGILLSGWLYAMHFLGCDQSDWDAWIFPSLCFIAAIYLAIRHISDPSYKFDLSASFKASLGVVVIGVVIFNITAYIFFRWVSPGVAPPFKAALLHSWMLLALGMILSLILVFLMMLFRNSSKS